MSALRGLFADRSGTMMLETALLTPVLLLLGIGAFQVSQVISAQHMLQSAAAEAEQIALAEKPDSTASLDTMKSVLRATTNLSSSQVTLSFNFRCGTSSAMVTDSASCASGTPAWSYVHIVLTDDFVPAWTAFGVGHTIPLRVDRTVQIA
jgi:Flp pilus assembly protein TadG